VPNAALRRYHVDDSAAVYELWTRTLGRDWPVDPADFATVVKEGFVAVHGGRIAGVAAIARENDRASLQLLLVDPDLRGRGIGTQLQSAALAELSRLGATRVHLAGTPDPYLWPGLPAEREEARRVLEHLGWQFDDPCWDLVRTLSDYETPPGIAPTADITYRRATEADRADLTAFEAAHFPEWSHYFAGDGLESAIIAVDERNAVVGSLLATDHGTPQLWRHLLGPDSGSIGAVGVAESVRDRGVGTAMLAHACESLRKRGVGSCHISWTTLLSFYGRLGFLPWRRYETASRDL
jgi:ribosomal protein S18 acetylase RimI-like enzyme